MGTKKKGKPGKKVSARTKLELVQGNDYMHQGYGKVTFICVDPRHSSSAIVEFERDDMETLESVPLVTLEEYSELADLKKMISDFLDAGEGLGYDETAQLSTYLDKPHLDTVRLDKLQKLLDSKQSSFQFVPGPDVDVREILDGLKK